MTTNTKNIKFLQYLGFAEIFRKAYLKSFTRIEDETSRLIHKMLILLINKIIKKD